MNHRLLILAVLLLSGNASAQSDAFEMSIPDAPGGGTPQVIGAFPANPASWAATLYFKTAAGACTSTVIGRRTLLTAAHCITDGQKGTIKIDGVNLAVTCNHHPGYAKNHQLDIALCLAQSDIKLPNGSKPETVSFSALDAPDVGKSVILLGYGCRQAGGDGPAGSLYQGPSTVSDYQGAYIVTQGGAAVCFGDSGGAAIYGTTDQRRVFAVNSRGDISKTSYLTSMSDPNIVRFSRKWANDNGQKICGLGEDLNLCRE